MIPRKKWSYFQSRKGQIELLEPRSMLSGHAIGRNISPPLEFHFGPAMFRSQMDFGGAARDGEFHSPQTVLAATLTDDSTGASATVSYQTSSHCGDTSTQFSVSVTGATADSTLDVSVDGTVVGQVATDANGAGTLKLSSKDATLPDDFPASVAAGAAITVGTMSGTLAASTPSGDAPVGHGGCSSSATTRLSATLTDSLGTASGKASYSTSNDEDEDSATTFSVSVTGATASTTFDVSIDTTVIGQLTTDENGAGTMKLSSSDSTLPANFPTSISAGSTITIGTLSGTFATSDATSNVHGFRFARWR
jgi:hypothetical protein